MTWGTHCVRCGREDCGWECGGTCEGSAVEAFDLDRVLFDAAMKNITQRRLKRRREAIHDAILLAGVTISLTIAIMAGVWCWLLVNGRV